ncbi:helix-turn-helix domain-containing protein [Pedobacter sp.]
MNEINILELRKSLKLTQEQLAELIGVSKRTIVNYEKGEVIPQSKSAILHRLKNEKSDFIKKPQGELTKNIKQNIKRKEGLIPFYNADFIAGNAELYYEDATIYPEYYLDVPEFSGCTAFRAFSDSMEKIIRSGSTLFGTNIYDWQSHLEYGQIYGITCKDGRRYLKYIRKDTESPKTHFVLRSENDNYDDFTLPKDKIKNIWLIEGWINKTT